MILELFELLVTLKMRKQQIFVGLLLHVFQKRFKYFQNTGR